MAKKSNIEWTDATWNPWTGCHKVSSGCQNCYMYREKKRFGQDPTKVIRSSDKTFLAPLKWKEPLRIMVCSWSDFFIEEADPWRMTALGIMQSCQQHTFIIPTKRTERIIDCLYGKTGKYYLGGGDHIPNIWFLASVENQETADKRIPELLKLRESGEWPVLGVSAEPLLGEIDLKKYLHCGLSWCIFGCESGINARPMKESWIRKGILQCKKKKIPVFYKQKMETGKLIKMPFLDGKQYAEFPETLFRKEK